MAQYSALAFVLLGIITLLKTKENGAINRTSTKFLLISSFSFAIAVGCRPSTLFWSILIPVMLWDKRKELMNNAGNLLAITIPFSIIGSILVWYNYARFGSFFEFGTSYMIGPTNQGMYSQVGIIGKIHILIESFLFYLFNPPSLDFIFPFISAKETGFPLVKTGFFYKIDVNSIIGIFCFPIMWFLFYVKKVDILRNFIFAGIIISLLNIAIYALAACIYWRYTMDFSWVMAIGALICAFQLQEKETAMRKVVLKTFYSCCAFTLLLVFFFTIYFRLYISDGDLLPILQIHHYLARTFGVICNVP